MSKYELIADTLQNQVDTGILTLEQAELVNDIAYEKYVTEKLETTILDKKLPNKKMTLYHGTTHKLTEVKAISVNMGTRLSRPRLSSFWTTNKDFAMLWAVDRLLCSGRKFLPPFILDVKNCKIVAISTDLKDGNRIVNSKKVFTDVLNNMPVYLYTKNDVPVKLIGRGQYAIDEYTMDKTVNPDKSQTLHYNDVASIFQYVSVDEYLKKAKEVGPTNIQKAKISFVEKLVFHDKDKTGDKHDRIIMNAINDKDRKVENGVVIPDIKKHSKK